MKIDEKTFKFYLQTSENINLKHKHKLSATVKLFRDKMKMTNLSYPILIYDNLCYSCTKSAIMVNSLLKNKCLFVGHYTSLGKEIKKNLFPKGYDGLEMSWFLIDGHAFGGRAALFRLIQYLLIGKKNGSFPENEFDLSDCSTDCKTIKGVFLRSYSIVTMHKKFSLLCN